MRRSLMTCLVCASVLLSGCAATGEPKSAGRTAAVSAPSRLWPGRTAPPQPTEPPAAVDTPKPLRALPRVWSGDMRRVPALDVARAVDEGCRAAGRAPCPMETPQYRDLTGDGKDELLLGVASGKTSLSLRAFTVRDGVVTQIMDAGVTPSSVELSGRDVLVREPASYAGYDLRRVYTWDAHLQVMNERVTEYVRR
ncbi:hypothetical protein [Streptomyces rimosus]|uniref:hypothetical protein n=1 Tax=Streptomyces rimosus TaxID=1927 RepID=UPI0037D44D62